MGVVVVASEASGVGKSVVAALIGRRRSGDRISVMFGGCGSVSGFSALCADVGDLRGDPGGLTGWDEALEAIWEGHATVCIDTVATGMFFERCVSSRLARMMKGAEVVLAVPVTCSEVSVAAAARTIERAQSSGDLGGFVFSRVALIYNERDGDPRELARERGLFEKVNSVARIGLAPSILGAMESAGLRLDVLDPFVGRKGVGAEVGSLLGWEKFRAGRDMTRYRDWLWDCEESLGLAGLLR